MAIKKIKNDVRFESLANDASSRVPYIDENGQLTNSSIVLSELLSIPGKIDNSLIGAANGVASLDGSGLIPSAQLPAIAVTSVSQVADLRGRDALTGIQEGDVAVVTEGGNVGVEYNVVAVADSGGSLDGTYFILQEAAGSVAFWIDVDDSGTAEPAHGADRSVEITTITTGMLVNDVATQLQLGMDADAGFSAGVFNDTAYPTAISSGALVALPDAGTSGFTVSVGQAGVDGENAGAASYIYSGVEGVDGVWNLLKSGDEILSVNGQTGAVNLFLSDLVDVDGYPASAGQLVKFNGTDAFFYGFADAGEVKYTPTTASDFDYNGGAGGETEVNALLDELGSRARALESQPSGLEQFDAPGAINFSAVDTPVSTGITFTTATDLGAELLVVIDSTSGTETFKLLINDDNPGTGAYVLISESVGGTTNVYFSITAAGDLQVSSSDYPTTTEVNSLKARINRLS